MSVRTMLDANGRDQPHRNSVSAASEQAAYRSFVADLTQARVPADAQTHP